MIVIIDYGMGNLRSVQKAIEAVGSAAEITSDPDRVRQASKVILPGVGAFADAMAELRRTGLGEAFREAVQRGQTMPGRLPGPAALVRQQHRRRRTHRARIVARARGPLPRAAGLEGAPHGLEHPADPQARAAAGGIAGRALGLFRPLVSRRGAEPRRCRRRGRLSRTVRGGRLARQPDGLPVPSREEPGDGLAMYANFVGCEIEEPINPGAKAVSVELTNEKVLSS